MKPKPGANLGNSRTPSDGILLHRLILGLVFRSKGSHLITERRSAFAYRIWGNLISESIHDLRELYREHRHLHRPLYRP